MIRNFKQNFIAILTVLLLVSVGFAQAGTGSSQVPFNTTLDVTASVTVTLSNASEVFTMSDASHAAAPSFNVITTWNLQAPPATGVNTVVALGSTASALSSGTNNIPSSQVMASYNGGAVGACNGTMIAGALAAGATALTNVCNSGGSPLLATTASGTRTDAVVLTINTGGPPILAGHYTGAGVAYSYAY